MWNAIWKMVMAPARLVPVRAGGAMPGANDSGRRRRGLDTSRWVMVAIVAMLAVLVADPAMAQAGGNTDSSQIITNVINWVTGPTGKGVCILAIAIAGLGCLGGALSVRMFGSVLAGVVLIFACSYIYQQWVG